MARYVFAVQSNAADGLEQEYNEWYSGQHLKDVLACPGVVGARRLTLADKQILPTPHGFKYFCLYEIELDDLQTFIDALLSRAGTERMPINKAMGNSLPVFWQVMV